MSYITFTHDPEVGQGIVLSSEDFRLDLVLNPEQLSDIKQRFKFLPRLEFNKLLDKLTERDMKALLTSLAGFSSDSLTLRQINYDDAVAVERWRKIVGDVNLYAHLLKLFNEVNEAEAISRNISFEIWEAQKINSLYQAKKQEDWEKALALWEQKRTGLDDEKFALRQKLEKRYVSLSPLSDLEIQANRSLAIMYLLDLEEWDLVDNILSAYEEMQESLMKTVTSNESLTMGSWISDRLGINIDVIGAISNATGLPIDKVIRAIEDTVRIGFEGMGKAIASLPWRKISHIFLVELNPVHFIWQGLSTNPLTGHAFRELNKLTGGLFTSTDKLITLPGRAGRGDAISKQELAEDAVFALRVAAVISTGGTAASVINFSSTQMKKGYLGETPLGRFVLDLGAAGAGAYFSDSGVVSAMEKVAVKQALNVGGTEVIKKNPKLQTTLGKYLVGGAAAGAEAGYYGENVIDATGTYAGEATKAEASGEIAKRTGLPENVARTAMDKSYPPTFESIAKEGTSSGFSFQSILDGIKNLNIDISLGRVNMPKVDIDPDTAGTPKEGSGWPHLALPELNIENIQMPDINTPSTLEGWEDVACKVAFVMGNKKLCGRKRKKLRVGRRFMWVYLLEDGSYYWTFENYSLDRTNEFLLYGLVAAAGIIMLTGSQRRA